jgi:hypothetical protein
VTWHLFAPNIVDCSGLAAEVLQKMLNLNAPAAPGKDPGELYKILVLDKYV